VLYLHRHRVQNGRMSNLDILGEQVMLLRNILRDGTKIIRGEVHILRRDLKELILKRNGYCGKC